ncbi:MAG: bifunctional oligoribonuclease/PAP phosphatase NrnA [Candidatus Omnitrophica bacterium]|nr:bifunctional oligoribonuclease/PAP phosphatase NrnA [Candidatus Omnitrophota bacterium]
MLKKKILDEIKNRKSFLVVAHIHPEGDSIGSQIALANLLKGMGKSVRVINEDKVPRNLLFLPGVDRIERFSNLEKKEVDFDAAIILDCPTLERIGKVKQLLGSKYIINIDHHISNEGFGDINWVDLKASSAGEMIYALFKSAEKEIDNASALCVYVAIMTDTGSFHYSNTTSQTHKIIAELLNFKINPTKIYEYIYETKSFDTLKLLAEVLANLQKSKDGKYVWFKVTDEMLKRNRLTAESTEDFIDFVRMIEGAEVVAYLRELDSDNKVKVSLRSKTDVDVNAVAKNFGGGGHYAASGCVIEKCMEETEQLLYQQIKKALKSK